MVSIFQLHKRSNSLEQLNLASKSSFIEGDEAAATLKSATHEVRFVSSCKPVFMLTSRAGMAERRSIVRDTIPVKSINDRSILFKYLEEFYPNAIVIMR